MLIVFGRYQNDLNGACEYSQLTFVKNGRDCVGRDSESVDVIRRHCNAQGLQSNCVCTETCHNL
jgi:hypothetical protein